MSDSYEMVNPLHRIERTWGYSSRVCRTKPLPSLSRNLSYTGLKGQRAQVYCIDKAAFCKLFKCRRGDLAGVQLTSYIREACADNKGLHNILLARGNTIRLRRESHNESVQLLLMPCTTGKICQHRDRCQDARVTQSSLVLSLPYRSI